MHAPWPEPDSRAADPRALEEFGALQELVGAIRSIRAEYNVQPGQTIRAKLFNSGPTVQAAVRQLKLTIQRLAKVSELLAPDGDAPQEANGAGAVLTDGTSLSIPLGDLVDVAKECARLKQEIDRLATAVQTQETKLANENS